MHKLFRIILCILPVVFFRLLGYNNTIKRKRKHLKENFKKVKKALDKPLSICYNKGTKKEQRVESQGNQKSSKKNKKSLDKQKPKCYNKDVKKTKQRKKEVMIMTKKMTKKEMFAEVIAVVNGAEVENKEEMLAFLNHEVELLNKKSGKSGETKTQKENKVLMGQLVEALSEMEKPVTISEFQAQSTHEVATLSNQKLSSLLKKLVEEENPRVVKTVEKKKSYFAVVRE